MRRRSTVGRAAAAALLAIPVTLSADSADRHARPRAGATVRVTATAYCHSGTTQSGTRTRTGIVAADPRVLPVGSVVRIVDGAVAGIYTVMDTGPAVKGPKIDIFIPNCAVAEEFGEQRVRVRLLRLGWDPKASAEDSLR
jgi:3D (Asp-Asp-Asp) domain-containing protein